MHQPDPALIADTVADERDLYGKYVVFKQGDDGLEGPLDGCFVLRPANDPAARKALSTYADADGVHGSPLARSLRQWLWDLRQIDGLEHATVALTDENGNDYEAGFTKRHNDGQADA